MEKTAPQAEGSLCAPAKLMLPLDFFELPSDGVRQHRLEDAIDRLALDMKERGQTSPILFYRKGLKGVIIGGGHRLLGARQNGWATIWAEERPAPEDETGFLVADFLDSDLQTPLTPLEEAAAFARAKELNPGVKDKVLAARFKVSTTKWSRRLSLFRDAGPQTMAALAKGLITADSAELIGKLHLDQQQVVIKEAEEQGYLKYRTVVRMIKEMKPARGRKPSRVEAEYRGTRVVFEQGDYDVALNNLRQLRRAVLKAKRANRPLRELPDFLRDDDGPKAA